MRVKCGKRCYDSRAAARPHLDRLRARPAEGYDGSIYFCPLCRAYHVGREKQRAHKNRYADRV